MLSKFFEPLAVAVAGGSSIKAAAVVVGCSEQTAYNISATPEFRQRVSEIRSEITTEAVGRLTIASTKAVDTLSELLNPEHEDSVRLQASKAVLTLLGPISETSELRARLDRLEKQQTAVLKVAQ